MNLIKSAAAFLLAMAAMSTMSAIAETAQETAVRKLIEPRLGKDAKLESITKTPVGTTT